jgi:hypothetical protein
MQSQSTQCATPRTTALCVTPVGSTGRVTIVTDGVTSYLVCRTLRGRGGWGVHTAEGDLLSSGWPTLTRARVYADRLLSRQGVDR